VAPLFWVTLFRSISVSFEFYCTSFLFTDNQLLCKVVKYYTIAFMSLQLSTCAACERCNYIYIHCI